MNLNLKLDGEEEQPLQYVNRFAINIPSGAAAFNLNIVNPGLSNQSYILNPVNPVGQNIVAYQSPMALQSYIALPTEGEGNILHGLPVGVSVPVGLPVPTGLLQNNFVNTSIIIGNEDCDSSGVIKSSLNNLNPENEIKINYIEKPVEELPRVNGIEVQDIGVNCTPQTDVDTLLKKPCPLEMSIKAANIDMEFEKCETEIPIILGNCPTVVDKPLLVESIPLEGNLKGVLKVPLEIPLAQVTEMKDGENKKGKTEITWENETKQESVDNGFQESLICEVEEANDDDEDEEEEEEDEEEEEKEDEVNCNYKTQNSINSKDSFKENNSQTELNSKGNRKKTRRRTYNSEEKVLEEGRKNKKVSTRKNHKEVEKEEEEREETEEDEDGDEGGETEGEKEDSDWSESDDDVLNLKQFKNEFNYKCYYEPNSTKSATSLVLKIDDKFKKFVRVRSCCSKKECWKKMTVQDQKTAHKNFYDLESNSKRDAYLITCIEHVQKNKNLDNAKDNAEEKYLEKTSIQLEIENESNGNQKLSDEIQNAINESLKDCVANEEKESESGESEETEEKGEKNTWNFFIVIDGCRKKVCLQFLLKLFQIPKSRVKHLQKKILSGSSLSENEIGKESKKFSNIWEAAKSHLESFGFSECVDCNANPRHRFLADQCTKEDLFDSFKDFYYEKLGKQPNIKYSSYKRFLEKKTSVSFFQKKEGLCSECEGLKKHNKKKQNKIEKTTNKGRKRRESTRQWVVKMDSEGNSSDDEPLLKRTKLKLTIPLKAVNKAQQSTLKRKSRKNLTENKNKGKAKQTGSRGRDVWSLMLLHLETMPFKECKSCVSKKRHRFLDSSLTTQGLFEDYRKYFLKETNSELGLGFTMYEKYFNRNCNYTICDVDENAPNCPRCLLEATKS